ncbi:MAG: NAD(P)-dependent oxidoreductase [Chloroflexi bacterium]|nr:NAD(P)-dependent oxidoreductase [Chloroflexota bacterium]
MILVTGGSGFLGQAFCSCLVAAGEQVLDASLNAVERSGVVAVSADISQRETLEGLFRDYPIDTVVHLASLLHTDSYRNPRKAFDVNVTASANLLELAHQHSLKRFVFGSTIDMLGYRPPEAGKIDESSTVLPDDLYGETKRFIENLGQAYVQQYGVSFISARIPLLIGPGRPISTSAWRMQIFNALRSEEDTTIEFPFKPSEMMAMAHIQDIAEALTVLTRAENPQHAIYHFPNETLLLGDLGKNIERISPRAHATYGQRMVDFCPPYLSWERFKNEFGFTPVSILDRLEQYHEEAQHVH